MKIFLYILTVITTLLLTYFAVGLFCVVLAFIMQFLFPVFMKIVDIQWPEWVIIHSGKFSSWFIFFLTIKFFIGTLIPIKPQIKEN